MTTTTVPQPPRGAARRFQAGLYRHGRAQLVALLTPPIGWFGVLYLGSLALLFVFAFWVLDPKTSAIRHDFSLANFQLIFTSPVYRQIALRTIGVAGLVTLLDIALAFPIAFFMARVARPRTRGLLYVAVLLPLWTSYLVRVYAWRLILAPGGPLDWLFSLVGLKGTSLGYSDLSMVIVFTYLWLPYMILPIFAGLERIPPSLLEASADLGGRGAMTFRKIVLPLTLPAVAAGSIFTFSLTLGDYITPDWVGNTQFIGNVVFQEQGVSGNLPLAAAMATIPVMVMGAFVWLMRRIGAFEAL